MQKKNKMEQSENLIWFTDKNIDMQRKLLFWHYQDIPSDKPETRLQKYAAKKV